MHIFMEEKQMKKLLPILYLILVVLSCTTTESFIKSQSAELDNIYWQQSKWVHYDIDGVYNPVSKKIEWK